MKIIRTLHLCFGILLLSFWTGCSSVPTEDTSAEQTKPRTARDALYDLRIGMEEAEVLEILGSPKTVLDRSTSRRKEERWTYNLGSIEEHVWVNDGNQGQVIADWRTGETEVRQQPTPSAARHTNPNASKELFLTFRDGKLAVIDRNLGGKIFPWER